MYGIFTIIYLHLPHKSTIHVGYHLWTPKPSKMKVTSSKLGSKLPGRDVWTGDVWKGSLSFDGGHLCLFIGYIGDEILPSYVGTIVNYYKDQRKNNEKQEFHMSYEHK